MEVAFVHLEHLVAQHELVLHDLGGLGAHHCSFEHQTFLNCPLSLEPESVALWALHDCFHQELELVRNECQSLLVLFYFIFKQMTKYLSSVVPERRHVRAQVAELFGLFECFK